MFKILFTVLVAISMTCFAQDENERPLDELTGQEEQAEQAPSRIEVQCQCPQPQQPIYYFVPQPVVSPPLQPQQAQEAQPQMPAGYENDQYKNIGGY